MLDKNLDLGYSSTSLVKGHAGEEITFHALKRELVVSSWHMQEDSLLSPFGAQRSSELKSECRYPVPQRIKTEEELREYVKHRDYLREAPAEPIPIGVFHVYIDGDFDVEISFDAAKRELIIPGSAIQKKARTWYRDLFHFGNRAATEAVYREPVPNEIETMAELYHYVMNLLPRIQAAGMIKKWYSF